jgi:hypothetical protein
MLGAERVARASAVRGYVRLVCEAAPCLRVSRSDQLTASRKLVDEFPAA